MDINATLFGQLITFAILVWFTKKYVWPPITKAIHEREKKIASGLEAAARGQSELEMAEHKSSMIIREAKQQANQIIEQANQQSNRIVEEAKQQAKQEGQRIVDLAQNEIQKEIAETKESLRVQLAGLAVAGAEKLIQRTIDPSAHQDILKQLAAEI